MMSTKKNHFDHARKLHIPAIPSLEADQCVLNSSLMIFHHVLVHIWVVFPDVSLCTPIRHGPKAKRW